VSAAETIAGDMNASAEIAKETIKMYFQPLLMNLPPFSTSDLNFDLPFNSKRWSSPGSSQHCRIDHIGQNYLQAAVSAPEKGEVRKNKNYHISRVKTRLMIWKEYQSFEI
jgi:hypothetical protein